MIHALSVHCALFSSLLCSFISETSAHAQVWFKKNPANVNSPDADAHILLVGADGCDDTLHLAALDTHTAGCPHIAELAQPFQLQYIGF